MEDSRCSALCRRTTVGHIAGFRLNSIPVSQVLSVGFYQFNFQNNFGHYGTMICKFECHGSGRFVKVSGRSRMSGFVLLKCIAACKKEVIHLSP
jgi:hypothetical protein